jgi:hypothetical protein
MCITSCFAVYACLLFAACLRICYILLRRSAHGFGHFVAVEAVTGVFYIAITVARLVAAYQQMDRERG